MRNSKLFPFTLFPIILISLFLGIFLGTRLNTVSAKSLSSERMLQIQVEPDQNAYQPVEADALSHLTDKRIDCYRLKNPVITIEQKNMTLADALNQNYVSADDLLSWAQMDAGNGICEKTAQSEHGLTCVLYRYPEFDLHVIHDIYETPDGDQHLIEDISLMAPGSHSNINHYYTDPDSPYGYFIDREDWGIQFEISGAATTGATLNYIQFGGQQFGELALFSYSLLNADTGTMLDSVSDADFFDEENPIILQSNGSYQLNIDWTALYGSLPDGNYYIRLFLGDIYDESQVHPLSQNFTDYQPYYVPFQIHEEQ